MVSDSNKNRYHTTPLTYIVFFIYCFLSIFEGYTNSIFGAVSRYYILLFIAYLLISGWVFKVQKGHYVLFVWLTFYIASLIWTPNFSQAMLYFYTIVGMTALLMIVLGMQFDADFVSRIIEVMALFSLLLGILGLFFSTSYMGVAASRQVLSLFGVQIDPNELVALYAIGAGMGLFYAFFSPKKAIAKITFGILSLVNIYGIFMTGSRSGVIVITVILIILLFHKSGYVSKGKNIFRRIIYSIFIIGSSCIPVGKN